MKAPAESLRIPCATYRFQFNRHFKFQDARALLAYLEALGITDVYSSPIFTAPPESNHGYDVCDYNQFNPVLGTEADWAALTNDLRVRGMGLLLDFVPNHMGTVPQMNPWWHDVLEFGVESLYAEFFDIDWNSPGLKNRVLLPILEDHYDKVLEKGLFKIGVSQGAFQIHYRDFIFPISPRSYRRLFERLLKAVNKSDRETIGRLVELLPAEKNPIDRMALSHLRGQLAANPLGSAIAKGLIDFDEMQTPAEVGQILEEQAYRLEYWRTGTLKANFRRFFDVNSLIAVNMNQSNVFEAAHELLLRCVHARQITGIRLDHIDGLADPLDYLQNLQAHLARENEMDGPEEGRGFYVLVEKITMAEESLRCDWPVFGTTGYDFGAAVTGVLVDSSQEEMFTQIYQSFVHDTTKFPEIVRNSKRWIMQNLLAREVALLSRLLKQYADNRPERTRLCEKDALAAITAVITFFPVYRTYMRDGIVVDPKDQAIIRQSVKEAQKTNHGITAPAFDLLESILLGESGVDSRAEMEGNLLRQRFQQFTGPIMAKSFEDTAFFVYNRLIALNEVGADPGRFGISPDGFHTANEIRFKEFPHAMLTTSTHDTKLSEDARARVAALSQLPVQWRDFLENAAIANEGFKTEINGRMAPDRNEEYLFYQILFATWPFEGADGGMRKEYTGRIQRHMLKAVREAKRNTRWDESNTGWEGAMSRFIDRVINKPSSDFSTHFGNLAQQVMELGAINSLSQTLLKLTAPGVPDIYQGNEVWQFILTDPDNRGSVDFSVRQEILDSLVKQAPADLLRKWQNGALKMSLIRTVLQYRQVHSKLFEEGEYVPLHFEGKFKNKCLGFARKLNGHCAAILVPRLTQQLGFPPIGDCWNTTAVCLGQLNVRQFADLFTGRVVEGLNPSISHIFRELPFAVLIA